MEQIYRYGVGERDYQKGDEFQRINEYKLDTNQANCLINILFAIKVDDGEQITFWTRRLLAYTFGRGRTQSLTM